MKRCQNFQRVMSASICNAHQLNRKITLQPTTFSVDIVYKHHTLLDDNTPCVVLVSHKHHTLLVVDITHKHHVRTSYALPVYT